MPLFLDLGQVVVLLGKLLVDLLEPLLALLQLQLDFLGEAVLALTQASAL